MVENAFRICLDPLFPPPSCLNSEYKYSIPENALHYNKFELVFDEDEEGESLRKLYQNSDVSTNLLIQCNKWTISRKTRSYMRMKATYWRLAKTETTNSLLIFNFNNSPSYTLLFEYHRTFKSHVLGSIKHANDCSDQANHRKPLPQFTQETPQWESENLNHPYPYHIVLLRLQPTNRKRKSQVHFRKQLKNTKLYTEQLFWEVRRFRGRGQQIKYWQPKSKQKK